MQTKLIRHYDAARIPCGCTTHSLGGIPCVSAYVVGRFDADDEPTRTARVHCFSCDTTWNYYPAKEAA